MNILELDSYNLADAVKFNSHLNPKIWGRDEKMKPEVRDRLLQIADDFREFLGINDLQLKDITISGSNAAYTYTPHSDVDLHLVVDLPEADQSEVYRELFDAKKYQYNDMHKIKIGGYDVELYVQNANQKHHSQGIYSVLNNEWIDVPKRRKPDVNDISTESKYEDLKQRIDVAIKSGDFATMDSLAGKIREMRQSGLDAHGEFGPENLAFKMLRSQGKIKELYNARNAAKDKELSLKERRPARSVFTYGFKHESKLDEVGITPDGVSPETCMFLDDEQSNPADEEILKDFIKFCFKELKLEQLPVIKLRKDPQWSVVHKTFGRYINDRNLLEVAWGQRHIMDVLRTVAHELTHRRQHEREGERMGADAGETGSPYENEANARAGILMRDYARLHPDYFAVGQAHGLHESIIDETAQDEKFLQQIGNAVEQWAEKYKATNKERVTGFVEPGTLGEITGLQGKTDAENHLLNLGMMFFLLPKDASGKHPLGAYRPAKGEWGGDIGADIRYLIPDAVLTKSKKGQEFTHTLMTHETDLASTVAHELRHALDDYLSKGKYDSSAHKFDYNDQTVEINAFFTQALKSLQQMIDDGTVDQDNLQWAIRRVFYNNELISNLVANKDPRVKRLFSRAYTYLQSELNKDQPLKESSGYIPTAAEAHDPRFEMALSVDVRPGALGKAANAFDLHTDSQGAPQIAKPNGLFERLQLELEQFKRKGTVVESEQLDEVRMAASNLKQFADSPEAEGIQCGFEAELIFRDTSSDENGDGDGDMEPDYDADERCRSLSQIVEFFEGGDYGYLSPRQRNALEEELDEKYQEWRDEQMYQEWADERDELVRDAFLDEQSMAYRIHAMLVDGMELTDEQADAIQAVGDLASKGLKGSEMSEEQLDMFMTYKEARSDAEEILSEEVESCISSEDGFYDTVLDDFRDRFEIDDDSGFFDDVGLRYMTDVASEFDLDWPYMMGTGGNGGERSWDSIGDSLHEIVGMPVKVSSGYHSATRKPGLWIVEPDSSLDPDDREDYGLEIVSPPMPLKQALEQLEAVTNWANNPTEGNAYTNSSTGLHMGVSIPYKEGRVDYLKLILFLGDEYVLKSFGRESNTYTRAAMNEIRSKAGNERNAQAVMDLLRSNLLELAERELVRSTGEGKYTSAHKQGKYIEFRSAGGDWLAEGDREPGKLENTMMRYAYAMYLAGRPDLERKEYYKKLYKLITPAGDDPVMNLFSQYASGAINKEQLKKQWAQQALSKDEPSAVAKGDWAVINKETGRVVQGQTYNGFTRDEVYSRAKAKLGEYMTKAAFDAEYSIEPQNTGRWEVYRDDHGQDETLEIVDADTRGAAADQAYDTYTDVIPFKVRPYYGDAESGQKPASTPRAKLAKKIIQRPAPSTDTDSEQSLDVAQNFGTSTNTRPTAPINNQTLAANGVPVWELFDIDTMNAVHELVDHTSREAYSRGMAWLQSVGAEDPATYGQRFAIRPKMQS